MNMENINQPAVPAPNLEGSPSEDSRVRPDLRPVDDENRLGKELIERSERQLKKLDDIMSQAGALEATDQAKAREIRGDARLSKKILSAKMKKLSGMADEAEGFEELSAVIEREILDIQKLEQFTKRYKEGVLTGDSVEWKDSKGNVVQGEVVRLGKSIDKVVVKRPDGKSVTIKKSNLHILEKVEDATDDVEEAIEDEPVEVPEEIETVVEKTPEEIATVAEKTPEEIAAENNIKADVKEAKTGAELLSIIEGLESLPSENGMVYAVEDIAKILEKVDAGELGEDAELLEFIPAIHGLRARVESIIGRQPFEASKSNYAEASAHLTKEYGTLSGWFKRKLNTAGYIEALSSFDDAKALYEKELALTVQENVETLMEERVAMVDAKFDKFQEKFKEDKGLQATLSRLYHWERKNPMMQKLRKGRMYIGLGVVGASMLGAPVAATLGGSYIAYRMVGAPFAAAGSYDAMNMGQDWWNSRMSLNNDRDEELSTFAKENKLSLWSRMRNKEIEVDGEKVKAGDFYRQKKAELQSEQVEEMTDEDLDNTLNYYEGSIAMQGKKPSDDPKYMMFIREKTRRYKLQMEDGESFTPGGESEPGRVNPVNERVNERQGELREQAVNQLMDYLKQDYLVSYKYHFDMVNSADNKEERRNSDAYATWSSEKSKLHQLSEGLTDELQTVIDDYLQNIHGGDSSKLSWGRKQLLLDVLGSEAVESVQETKKNDIEPADVWDADWQFNAAFKSRLEEVLKDNELINKQAEDEVRQEMGQLIDAVEAQDQAVQEKAESVNNFLDILNKEAEEEQKRVTKGWQAMRHSAYKKIISLMVGWKVFQGASDMQEQAATAASETMQPRIGMPGLLKPMPADLPPAEEWIHEPVIEPIAPESGELPSMPPEIEVEAPPSVELDIDMPVNEKFPFDKFVRIIGTHDPLTGNTINGLHRAMDPVLNEWGHDMFPDQWDDALEQAGGETDKADKIFDKFIHKFKIDELKRHGFKFKGGQYGYPFSVSDGAQFNLVKDATEPLGWKTELIAEGDTVNHHDDIKWSGGEAEPEVVRKPAIEYLPTNEELASKQAAEVEAEQQASQPESPKEDIEKVEAEVEEAESEPEELIKKEVIDAKASVESVETNEDGVKTKVSKELTTGKLTGWGEQQLEEAGILDSDWKENVKGGPYSLRAKSITAQARLFVTKMSVIDQAEADGNVEKAAALKKSLKKSLELASKRNPGVYGDFLE